MQSLTIFGFISKSGDFYKRIIIKKNKIYILKDNKFFILETLS